MKGENHNNEFNIYILGIQNYVNSISLFKKGSSILKRGIGEISTYRYSNEYKVLIFL